MVVLSCGSRYLYANKPGSLLIQVNHGVGSALDIAAVPLVFQA